MEASVLMAKHWQQPLPPGQPCLGGGSPCSPPRPAASSRVPRAKGAPSTLHLPAQCLEALGYGVVEKEERKTK